MKTEGQLQNHDGKGAASPVLLGQRGAGQGARGLGDRRRRGLFFFFLGGGGGGGNDRRRRRLEDL